MHWRVWAVVLVAVTAGCGSVGGLASGPPTETVTPAPVPTPPPTPVDPRMGLAPGVNASGIFDMDYLVAHHVEAAASTSYTWTERERLRFEVDDRTTVTNHTHRVVVENGTRYLREAGQLSVQETDGYSFYEDYAVFANGSVEFSRWTAGTGGLQYGRSPVEDRSLELARLSTEPIRRYLDVENQTVARLTLDGRTHYQVTGTSDTSFQYGPVENYTVRAVVRDDGFVRSLDVSFVRPHATGGTVHHHYWFSYDDVGTATVSPPSWIERVGE